MGRHKEWRKLAKKCMRKRKRSIAARERDARLEEEEKRRSASPSYQVWLAEQLRLEEFLSEENERIRAEKHRQWLLEEEAARERWLKQQKKLERLKLERAKQEMLIREEWEREREKLELEATKRQREREMKEEEETELLNRIERYILGECENLPASARTVTETQPGCDPCPFFAKVAACRFRDSCSRNHIKPSVSRTVLIPNFYTHFRMEHINQCNEYDADVGLEYDDREIYNDFLEFYDDVLGELRKFGAVVQFKVCCNEEAHLRGNVYVQYQSERSAIKAFRALQGRFYGGKRVSAEFCNVPSWSKALCGLFSRRKCPKGGKCNFLHAFRNPNAEFARADRDAIEHSPRPNSLREKSDWSWSPSPIREREREYDSERRSECKENASERRRRQSQHSHRSSRHSSKDRKPRAKRRRSSSSSPKKSKSRRPSSRKKRERRSSS